MTDPLQSTFDDPASVDPLNKRMVDNELVAHSLNTTFPDEIVRRSTRERADRFQTWHMLSSGHELGMETGRNNKFMAVFSHELRNSLHAIRGAAHILRMDKYPDPTAVKARVLIERQVGQMTRLVEDLLDVSRARSGQLSLKCERIDLRDLAARAAQTVEFTMQQRLHRITTSFPDSPVWLLADPARLEQVFVNLLLNAAKYTDDGGNIELSVKLEDVEAIVRISDSGIGIDPDDLPHVFDLFVQADSSAHRADAGLGIGLALVRSLVERHGGLVMVASAGLGHGSEFTVRLPRLVE